MKAHKSEFGFGIKSIRFGESVPESDVNLAYSWTRELSFADNVEMRDLISARHDLSQDFYQREFAPCLMAPDESSILRRIENGLLAGPYIRYRHFALTNEFSGGYTTEDALYYHYTLSQYYAGWEHDIQGAAGEYTGPGIRLVSLTGRDLPPGSYCIILTRMQVPWVYKAEIYLKSTPESEAGVAAKYTPAVQGPNGYIRAPEAEEIITLRSVFLPEGPRKYELIDDGSGYGYKIKVPGYTSRSLSPGTPFSWRIRGSSSLGWEVATDVFFDCAASQDGDKLLYDLTCDEMLQREYSGISVSNTHVELVSGSGVSVFKGPDGKPYAKASIPRDEPAPGEALLREKRSFTAVVEPVLYKNWEDFTWTAVGTGKKLGDAGAAPHDGAGLGNGLWKRWANSTPLSPVNDYSMGHSGWQYFFSYNWSVTTTFETNVFVPKDVSVSFRLGNNDDITIWVNGTEQYRSGSTVSWSLFGGYKSWTKWCTLRLKKGWNKIRAVVHETGFWDNWTSAWIEGAFHYHLQNALEPGMMYAINDVVLPLDSYSVTISGSARCSLYPTQDAEITIGSITAQPGYEPGQSSGFGWDMWKNFDFRWQSVSTTNPNVSITPAPDFAVSGRFTAHMKSLVKKPIGRQAVFSGLILPDDGIVVLGTTGSLPNACGVNGSLYTQEERDHIYYTLRCSSGEVNLRYRRPSGSYSVITYGDMIGTSAVSHTLCEAEPQTQIIAWATYSGLMAGDLFAVKPTGSKSMTASPTPVLDRENWYISIGDSFAARDMRLPENPHPLYSLRPELLPYAGEQVTLVYMIPEYANQSFSPYEPVMRVTEEPVIIDDYTISVSRPIHLGGIEPGSDSYSSIQLSYGKVKAVNAREGIIYLDRPIQPGAELLVTYDAEVYTYRYRGYRQDDAFIHLDLNPGPYHTLTADAEMNIPGHTSKIQPVAHPVREMLNREILVYLIPHSILHQGGIIPGTLKDRVIYHTTLSSTELNALDPTVLEVAALTIVPGSSLRDIVLIDTRSRGGGLKEEITQEIIDRICPEARFYWDIGYWDGMAYKETGVVIVELPKAILKSNGGRFAEQEVEEILHKYVALGVLPVVRYY